MTSDSKLKILDLLQTGKKANIKIGLSIVKSNKLDFDFSIYENLFKVLVDINIIKDAKRLETKLIRIFNINSLSLSSYELHILAPHLDIFTSLKKIDVVRSHLKSIPEGLFNTPNLISLNLSVNNLKEISPNILKLKKLKELILGFNSISESSISNVVCKMKQLTCLVLTGNRLKHIPKEIENLDNLKELSLPKNSLVDLPISFKNLHHLEDLSLYHNYNLKGLPECIYQLPKLNKLTISKSNATKNQLLRLTKLRPNCLVKFF